MRLAALPNDDKERHRSIQDALIRLVHYYQRLRWRVVGQIVNPMPLTLPGTGNGCSVSRADPLVRAGPPGPAPCPARSASCNPREADRGVGRGPGGPPHYLCRIYSLGQSKRQPVDNLPHERGSSLHSSVRKRHNGKPGITQQRTRHQMKTVATPAARYAVLAGLVYAALRTVRHRREHTHPFGHSLHN